MAKGVGTIELPKPPEQVWALLTNRTRYGEWLTVHAAWDGGSATGFEVGATFTQRLQLDGPPAPVVWIVTTYEPGANLELSGRGATDFRARLSYTVAATRSGSVVELVLELFGGALDGSVGKLIEPGLCREMTRSLRKLAELN
ncbi:type II toxin-antitoxin system Rv0910 family toxin [Nocardia pseudobrasiliensis]|uniref:Polyketide cyclase/dehydrase/lipid transport protein n=1 Tax=Nocardia pseudobrasiliensis TaxID=45979 RepID=A0A370IBN3_9NOCA|nr:SRPBCC family protein [Nocardia pseudobrasiliensis]RDI68132.1 polyketide cyclase/dehydrase/lipid transport protein [Nocardia pseudobrasiliensis]